MLNITIPPLPDPPKKKSAYFKRGDITLVSMGSNICLKATGMSYVDPSPSNKIGASGQGGTHAYIPLPEAEQLLEALQSAIEKLKERV